MKLIEIFISCIFFLISILRKLIFKFKKNFKINSKVDLIFYIPTHAKGWILEFLTFDIRRSSELLYSRSLYINNYFVLIYKYIFFPNSKIVCFSYGFANYLIKRGFNKEHIILLFTHHKEEIRAKSFNKFCAVLFMNKKSMNWFFEKGLQKRKGHYFPIGYDPKIFKIDNNIEKIYDLVVPMKYINKEENIDYYIKKNYDLVIPLINNLTKKGFKVCVLGSGWHKCSKLSNRVKKVPLRHEETSLVYSQSKIDLCLSIDEGGFTGTIESIACGCHIFSHEIRFANDLKKKLPYEVELIPFLKSEESYVNLIEQYINNYKFKINKNLSNILNIFEFESLSKVLLEINK